MNRYNLSWFNGLTVWSGRYDDEILSVIMLMKLYAVGLSAQRESVCMGHQISDVQLQSIYKSKTSAHLTSHIFNVLLHLAQFFGAHANFLFAICSVIFVLLLSLLRSVKKCAATWQMNDVMWMFASDNEDVESDVALMTESRADLAEFMKVAEKVVSTSVPTESFKGMAAEMNEFISQAKAGGLLSCTTFEFSHRLYSPYKVNHIVSVHGLPVSNILSSVRYDVYISYNFQSYHIMSSYHIISYHHQSQSSLYSHCPLHHVVM